MAKKSDLKVRSKRKCEWCQKSEDEAPELGRVSLVTQLHEGCFQTAMDQRRKE